MKTIIKCKQMAMEQTKPVLMFGGKININPMGYVIIKNNPETIMHWNKLGYDVTYDYIIFSDYDEMQLFIDGCCAYDYIDNCHSIGNDTIVYVSWNDTMILF